jgi:hypothetical protein
MFSSGPGGPVAIALGTLTVLIQHYSDTAKYQVVLVLTVFRYVPISVFSLKALLHDNICTIIACQKLILKLTVFRIRINFKVSN